ncbi:MAG: ABC transporter ATP-binding protein [Eubacterium sp.]|nr:ABC transporter ATP-binding protein [Eubacterium sp.]
MDENIRNKKEDAPYSEEPAAEDAKSDEILRYEQVEISYNGKHAVEDISFTLNKGEILGIVGESGSGKSTLIKAAMGLLGPAGMVTRGDIWYKGKDLPDLSDKEIRKINGKEISMIFQFAGSSFCPIRTVGSQLYESMTEHEAVTKQDFEKKATDLLQKIGFEDGTRILNSYPFELSGGMQQRVGIAAAMLMNPAILMADEPTSALDVSVQKQVVDEMKLVREMFGTSIIIVTHNIGVIGAMADRVLVMQKGKMVEYGETSQVLHDPQKEYTKKLMAAVPKLRR